MFWHFLYENLLLYKAYQDQVFGKKLPKIYLSHAHTSAQLLENLAYNFESFRLIVGNIPHFFEENIIQKYIEKDFFENIIHRNTLVQCYQYINSLNFTKLQPVEIIQILEQKPDFLKDIGANINTEIQKNKNISVFLAIKYAIIEGNQAKNNHKILQIFTKNREIFSTIYQQKKLPSGKFEPLHFQILQEIYVIDDEITDFRHSFLYFAMQNLRNISYPKMLIQDFLAINYQEKYDFLVGKNEFEPEFLQNFGIIICDLSTKDITFLQQNTKNYLKKCKEVLANLGVLVLIFPKKQIQESLFLMENFDILLIIDDLEQDIFVVKNKVNAENLEKNSEKKAKIKLLKIKAAFDEILEKHQNIDTFYQKTFVKNQEFEDETCILKHISQDIFQGNYKNIDVLFQKSTLFLEIFYKNSYKTENIFKPLKTFFEVKKTQIFDRNVEIKNEKSAFFIFENLTNGIENTKNFAQKNEFLNEKILYLAHNCTPEMAKITGLEGKNISILQNNYGDWWLLENDFLVNFIENEDDILIFEKDILKNTPKNSYQKQLFVCDIPLDILVNEYPFAYQYASYLIKMGENYQISVSKKSMLQQKNSFFVSIFPKEKPKFYANFENENVIFSDNFFEILPKKEFFESENLPFFDAKRIQNYLNSAIFGLFFYENLPNFNNFSGKLTENKMIFLMQRSFSQTLFLDFWQEIDEKIETNEINNDKVENDKVENNKDKTILRQIGFTQEKEIDKICKNLYQFLEQKTEQNQAKNLNPVLVKTPFSAKENVALKAILIKNVCKKLNIELMPTIDFLKTLAKMLFLFDIYFAQKEELLTQKIVHIFWKNVFNENFNLRNIEKRNQQKLFE